MLAWRLGPHGGGRVAYFARVRYVPGDLSGSGRERSSALSLLINKGSTMAPKWVRMYSISLCFFSSVSLFFEFFFRSRYGNLQVPLKLGDRGDA